MNRLFIKIKSLFETYKDSILRVENKQLTTGSKVSLVVFVLIVFTIIGAGVEMQQSYIVKPHKQFSYKCTNLIEKNREIDKFQNRNISQDVYGVHFRYKEWSLSDFKYNHQRKSENNILRSFGTNGICQQMGKLYLDVANSDEYKDKLIIQQGLKKKINSFNALITRKTDEYANSLLEKIANQEAEYSILSTSSKTIKKELKENREKLAVLEKELYNVENIRTLKEFTIFKNFLDNKSDEILSKQTEAIKQYRFKYTLNIFVFLFPVWILFYVAYRILKRKNFFVTSHLSLNVANVAALYIVYNIFLLIYTIIPKIFLKRLIDFLSQYNLTLVLNIAAILFFMALFGFFINRIQRNKYKEDSDIKTIDRLKDSRIKNLNSCVACGNQYNENDTFCGVCSHELKRKCMQCDQVVSSDYKYCTYCQGELDN